MLAITITGEWITILFSRIIVKKGIRLMNLVNFLSKMIKPELEELKRICNFTEEEELIFDELSKKRSRIYIADKYSLSCSTVSNRIKSIQEKIHKAKEWEESHGKSQ